MLSRHAPATPDAVPRALTSVQPDWWMGPARSRCVPDTAAGPRASAAPRKRPPPAFEVLRKRIIYFEFAAVHQ